MSTERTVFHVVPNAGANAWLVTRENDDAFRAEYRTRDEADNTQPTIGFNTAVTPDPNSPLDELGLPTGFVEGPRFGNAEEVEDFPLARTFRVAIGFRF